ncbi:Organellar oligopeptidase A, chloroplastic/mitochondrial [Capsicum baccatum]|uniref:Organellar oligopeptidase A, chloroplastic/mitochondrial n=1 Tax=Capsicum baccatum TaxID=33114 RepID=A0A2G2XH80_CAPBA|nr:Organellar oligopeptidase A, chloroplastic/mitochondrial [Capsicum baccatum]
MGMYRVFVWRKWGTALAGNVLRSQAFPLIFLDLVDLKEFCKSQGSPEADDLNHWDITFWSERFRESKYELNEEELRPYLSLPRVMDGLFNLVNILFGINVEPADGLAPVWNHDVRFYRVNDSSGTPIAYFYFDPYSRPSEKSGVGDKPSLMTFLEVETVFHEFGHALQHMLTKQDEGLVAGLRGIERDARELPSQFMENWCYHSGQRLSADAFSAFEDVGLENEKAVKETGQRFRETVLALGGGKAPLEVFVLFRGREPSPEALLRHHGLLSVTISA